MLTGGKFGKHLQRLSTQWVYSALQLGNLLDEQSVARLHSEIIGRLGELIHFQGISGGGGAGRGEGLQGA